MKKIYICCANRLPILVQFSKNHLYVYRDRHIYISLLHIKCLKEVDCLIGWIVRICGSNFSLSNTIQHCTNPFTF